MTDVLLLCGSPRRHKYTHSAVLAMAERLHRRGATATTWHQSERPLPLFDPAQLQIEEAERHGADRHMHWLRQVAWRADAFVWASPVYHNSYSGVLKNALDTIPAGHHEEKPVALVSHGSSMSGVRAADHLRLVARGVHADAIPTQITTVPDDFARPQVPDAPYPLQEGPAGQRLDVMAEELLARVEPGAAPQVERGDWEQGASPQKATGITRRGERSAR